MIDGALISRDLNFHLYDCSFTAVLQFMLLLSFPLHAVTVVATSPLAVRPRDEIFSVVDWRHNSALMSVIHILSSAIYNSRQNSVLPYPTLQLTNNYTITTYAPSWEQTIYNPLPYTARCEKIDSIFAENPTVVHVVILFGSAAG